MKDYLLFIDTEASGLPKNWNLPYDVADNWPFCVQIAWIICRCDGKEIKEENHYIKNDDFTIAPSANKIHGITREFLQKKGEYRNIVLQLLLQDLVTYKPLIVGHFVQFDLHMLGADFFREGMEETIKIEDTFCTMIGSAQLIKNPAVKFLRLEQLYQTLFGKTLNNLHDAIVDAHATASCFFELVKRGEINEQTILLQQNKIAEKNNGSKQSGCILPMFLIILMMAIIYYV